MSTQYRIEMANNSDARRADRRTWDNATSVRHNGGKVVIAETDDAEAFEDELDADHSVTAYTAS